MAWQGVCSVSLQNEQGIETGLGRLRTVAGCSVSLQNEQGMIVDYWRALSVCYKCCEINCGIIELWLAACFWVVVIMRCHIGINHAVIERNDCGPHGKAGETARCINAYVVVFIRLIRLGAF